MPALRVPVMNLWNKLFDRARAVTTRSKTRSEKQGSAADGAWDGGNRATAEIAGVNKTVDSNNSNSTVSSAGKMKRKQGEKSWYERALMSLNRDDTTMALSRNSSQDELNRSHVEEGHGVPEVMELGAIYKTTDLHVSTTDVKKEPKPERSLSLVDFLKESN